MMKSGICIAVIIACTINTSRAQYKVYGIIVDQNETAIANANVLLLNAKDSSLVKGNITASNGTFDFEIITTGNYLVTSTHTGLIQVYSSPFTITENQNDINIGTLKLMDASAQLNTVTVVARRPVFEQKIDRLVINVENSIAAAGNTALSVLERSPGVIVDRQNNTISMNGKDGVQIMMNGKLSRMPIEAAVQLLEGMSSSNIDRIELITTPPANLDAEGNAGYINIVLKENNNYGTNGSFSTTLGYGQGPVAAASININHRKGKVNLYGDLSWSRTKTTPFIWGRRKVSNNGVFTESYSSTDRESTVTNYNGRLGLDYQMAKKTVIGFLLSAYDNEYAHDAVNTTTFTRNNHLDTTLSIVNTESNRWKNFGGNINMQHSFKANDNVSVNFDYIYYTNNQPVDYFNSYYDGSGNFLFQQNTRSGKTTPIDLWVAAVDYTKKLSAKVTMETGMKGTKSAFNNNISFDKWIQNTWENQKEGTAKYKLNEKYGAAYASFNVIFSERTTMKSGLRYEYTTSNLGTEDVKDIVDRKYGKLFPTFFLSHKIDDNNAVNFSYNRRITRPTFNALAPFTYYIDPYSLLTGNPTLQPAISNMIKGDYVFKKYLLSLSYTKEDQSITGFQPETDSVNNKIILSPQNLVNQKIISAVISVPVTVSTWWSMQFNVTGVAEEVNALYKNEPVRLKQVNMNISGSQRFSLPKAWSIEVSGFYRSKSLGGITVIKPYGSLDFGIKKTLKDKRNSFVFNGSNILRTFVFQPSTDLPDQNLYGSTYLRFFGSTYKLTYSRSFGNDKLKGKRDRLTGSEAERARVE
ncbi:MAG: TonB-dependent receptor [Chitinophagaceae bacterium]|nr:TonB-dependent receptor [Chitinophagaceae bacterium]